MLVKRWPDKNNLKKKVMNEDYVKNSNKKIHKEIKEKNIGKTKVFIKDPLPEHINLENVFET